MKKLPIASAQTLTIADKNGKIAVVECNCEEVIILYTDKNNFLVSTNYFTSEAMMKYNAPEDIDNWRAEERYKVAKNNLINKPKEFGYELLRDILSGKHGFMCQYDRKKNTDTVWSVIYDLKKMKIYRVEGNPGRKKYVLDERLKLQL